MILPAIPWVISPISYEIEISGLLDLTGNTIHILTNSYEGESMKSNMYRATSRVLSGAVLLFAAGVTDCQPDNGKQEMHSRRAVLQAKDSSWRTSQSRRE